MAMRNIDQTLMAPPCGSVDRESRGLGKEEVCRIKRVIVPNRSHSIDLLELLSSFRALAHCLAMAFFQPHAFLFTSANKDISKSV